MARNSWLSRLLVFWPGRPWNAGLFFSVAGKATLLWPGLPQNPGLDRAYQAFPGHAFLASPARLGRACHAFDHAPDARVGFNILVQKMFKLNIILWKWKISYMSLSCIISMQQIYILYDQHRLLVKSFIAKKKSF